LLAKLQSLLAKLQSMPAKLLKKPLTKPLLLLLTLLPLLAKLQPLLAKLQPLLAPLLTLLPLPLPPSNSGSRNENRPSGRFFFACTSRLSTKSSKTQRPIGVFGKTADSNWAEALQW